MDLNFVPIGSYIECGLFSAAWLPLLALENLASGSAPGYKHPEASLMMTWRDTFSGNI